MRISLSSRNGSPLGRIFELAAFPLATMVFVTATASTAVSGDGCSHDPCYQGAALASSCSPCVTQICDANASCCSTTWNLACALATDDLCNKCEPLCGDATEDRRLTAPDALAALRTAVGTGDCAKYLCDFNGDGDILSTDALLILRAGVGAPHSPACPPPPALHQFVVDQIALPETAGEAADFAFNIDDDAQGHKDNAFGSILATLADQSLTGFVFQEAVDAAIASGELVELISLSASDLVTDSDAAWRFHTGDPAAGPPDFDGHDVFTIDQSGVLVDASIAQGHLSAEQAVGTTGTTPLRVVLVSGGPLLELDVLGLHLSVDVTESGCIGRVGGAVSISSIEQEFLPAWAIAIDESITAECHAGAATSDYSACDGTSKGYLQIFDEDPLDGHISVDEFRNNSFIQTLFRADVAVIDENGAYNPDLLGNDEPDALSLGLGFSCVAAQFEE